MKRAILICVLLCTCFAILSYSAARKKGATADENNHAVVGWFMRWQHDFRLSPDVPPLWEYWASFGAPHDAVRFDPDSDGYRNVRIAPIAHFWSSFERQTLLARGRAMCLILAVALAVVISIWSWQLAGPIASIAATFLYTLDPNFLGHGSLLKNDIAGALLFLASMQAIWLCGQRLTWLRGLSAVLLISAAVNVKLNGLILIPLLVVSMLIRAISNESWRVLRWNLTGRQQKLAASAAVCALVICFSYVMIWGCYLFRFNAGPDGLQTSLPHMEQNLGIFALRAQLHRNPTRAELDAWQPGLTTRAIMLAERIHFVPQAYAAGLLFTQMSNQGDQAAYLLGEPYHGGKWIYFPLAFVFKEPLALIAAVLIALGIAIRARRYLLKSPADRWTACCLALPAGIYALIAFSSDVNIGFRHFFPVLPFVFIAAGLAAVRLWQSNSGRLLIAAIGLGLAIESAAAFPDYTAFFNAASAPYRMQLLADSNLDWGQDLPQLAAWQQEHPNVTLYLDYFGDDDPDLYGLKYIDVDKDPIPAPHGDAVVAVSATFIQLRTFNTAAMVQLNVDLNRPPLAVLGGTIYIFRTSN